MAAAAKERMLVARESFSTEVDGEVYVAQKGVTRVRADHPLAKSNPDHFEPADDSPTYEVEQATAAPGEKRGQRKRRAA